MNTAILIIKNILKQRQNSTQEQPCPFTISQHIWSSALKTLIFSSKVNSMNRSGQQPWNPPSNHCGHLVHKEIKTKAISTAANLPRLWKRYVDDTFLTQRTEYRNQFLQHLNSTDPHIQFTTEEMNTDGFIPFLDIILHQDLTTNVLVQCIGNLPTETSTFIWIATITFLPSTTCTTSPYPKQGLCVNPQLLQKEEVHIKGALQKCKFPF